MVEFGVGEHSCPLVQVSRIPMPWELETAPKPSGSGMGGVSAAIQKPPALLPQEESTGRKDCPGALPAAAPALPLALHQAQAAKQVLPSETWPCRSHRLPAGGPPGPLAPVPPPPQGWRKTRPLDPPELEPGLPRCPSPSPKGRCLEEG